MSEHKTPLVSIVTVVYNNVSETEKTILSVLDQTYENIEYIIIDGGSTDGTVDIIKKYDKRISYWISEPDKGIYDAMNKGIDKTSGEWINFMNAGDSFYNDTVVEDIFISFNDNPDIIYGDTALCYEWVNVITAPLDLSEIQESMPLCHQSIFVRNSLMKKYKFNTHYKVSADYDFLLKVYNDRYNFKYIPLCISSFDYTEGVSKRNRALLRAESAKIAGKKFDYKWKYKLFVNTITYSLMSLIYKLMPKKKLQKRKLSQFAKDKRIKKIELLN